MDYEASKTNAGEKTFDVAGEAIKKATSKQ